MQRSILRECRRRVITPTHTLRLGASTRSAAPCYSAINNTAAAARWNSTGVRKGLGLDKTSTRSQLAGSLHRGAGAGVPAASYVKNSRRGYASTTTSSGKTEADEMVEELQDLYEIAKDEFEIATESTSSSTIYAASDRTTAREALTDLQSLYNHYTSPPSTSPTTTASPTTSPNPADESPTGPSPSGRTGSDEVDKSELGEPGVDAEGTGVSGGDGGGSERVEEGQGVKANFNAEAIAPEVREEIRRRVGQRVRELKAAVDALEERAMED